jgi:hypothetical protein
MMIFVFFCATRFRTPEIQEATMAFLARDFMRVCSTQRQRVLLESAKRGKRERERERELKEEKATGEEKGADSDDDRDEKKVNDRRPVKNCLGARPFVVHSLFFHFFSFFSQWVF